MGGSGQGGSCGERVDLLGEHAAAAGVLIAQIDINRLGLDGPGGDQRALQEAVRVALQVMAVLEGAGLALVDVDGHEPRFGLIAQDAPLAPGGEPGAAQPPELGVFE